MTVIAKSYEMKKFIPIAVLILLTGCTTILKKMYKIEQPKIETVETLNHFLKENGFSDDMKIYTFSDINAFYVALNSAELPGAQFFNHNGSFVDYRLNPADCNAQIGPFIENAQNINILPANDSIKIQEVLKSVIDLQTRNPVEIDKDADGYLILYWAKFIGGRLNKEKSLDWIQIFEESRKQGADYQLIFLNMDYQDFWGISEEDIPEFDID